VTLGRPRALTPDLMAEICARIADGETVRQIAASEHMVAASTIYSTLAADKDFADQYARAREAQLLRWEDELLEIADDATNDWMVREGKDGDEVVVPNHDHIQRSKVRLDTRKWLMSKRAPKKYGERIETEHSGAVSMTWLPPQQ
jgi:hypothetical protein